MGSRFSFGVAAMHVPERKSRPSQKLLHPATDDSPRPAHGWALWKSRLRTLYRFFSEVYERFDVDGGSFLGAALAFHALMSVAPLLVVAVAVAGTIFGEEAARGELFSRLEEPLGVEGAALVSRLMEQTYAQQSSGTVALLSVGFLFFAASRLFIKVQESLNHIWGVRVEIDIGLTPATRALAKKRLLSFLMVLISGLLFGLQLLAKALLSGLNHNIQRLIPVGAFGHLTEFAFSTALLALIFASLFRIMPDVRIARRDIWIGALFTALLVSTLSLPVSWYLAYLGTSSTYGAAGSVVLLLLWFYYISLAFLFGAEFISVWAQRHGREVEPESYAMRVVRDVQEAAQP